MEKRHRKFFYAFLLFNCFLSPACNHKTHEHKVDLTPHTNVTKNTVIKAGINATYDKPLLNLRPDK
jgi:hypothetical protein